MTSSVSMISSSESHNDFIVVKLLSRSKFPVYLATSRSDPGQEYALKVFPYKKGKAVPNFLRESHISRLSHPNLVLIYHSQKFKNSMRNGVPFHISYILMEYAPYGDFCDIISSKRIPFDEKLIRTYFHQFISGLEYLHKEGVAHLDIKPENILLGKDYLLKIADFDLCYIEGDTEIASHGTKNYRAPELIGNRCEDPYAADIFSAGIFLFCMKAGNFPQSEESLIDGYNLLNLMFENPDLFWETHTRLQNKGDDFFESSFRELFLGMTQIDPKKRYTIQDIKKSEWYNGTVYTSSELKELMEEYLSKN